MYWRMDPDSVRSVTRGEKRIVSLGYKQEDEVIIKVQEALKEAARNAGYDLAVLYSDNSADVQLAQVRNARKRGTKGIFINLVTPESAPAILEAAGDMKVIFIAHPPADMSILNKNAIYMGADQGEAGKLQGAWLANYFKERGKTEIRYILISGGELPVA